MVINIATKVTIAVVSSIKLNIVVVAASMYDSGLHTNQKRRRNPFKMLQSPSFRQAYLGQ